MLWRSSRGRPLNAPAAFIHLVWLMLPVRVRLRISSGDIGDCRNVLGAEAAFSLVGLSYVPLRLQGNLPEDVRIFESPDAADVVERIDRSINAYPSHYAGTRVMRKLLIKPLQARGATEKTIFGT